MSDNVECHSESTYAEKPVALTVDGQRRAIVEIISRWRSPDEIHFRVRTADGLAFELTYEEAADRWHIQTI